MFGTPTAPELREASSSTLSVTTEKEDDGEHGIWFNRGAIASQAYARKFKNHKPTEEEMNDPKDKHTSLAVARPARGLPRIYRHDQEERGVARLPLRIHLRADHQGVQGEDR